MQLNSPLHEFSFPLECLQASLSHNNCHNQVLRGCALPFFSKSHLTVDYETMHSGCHGNLSEVGLSLRLDMEFYLKFRFNVRHILGLKRVLQRAVEQSACLFRFKL